MDFCNQIFAGISWRYQMAALIGAYYTKCSNKFFVLLKVERRKDTKELRIICEQGQMVPSCISGRRKGQRKQHWPEKQVENCARPYIVAGNVWRERLRSKGEMFGIRLADHALLCYTVGWCHQSTR